MSRSVEKQARGFSYQRLYCVYLFFESIHKKTFVEIIEEGKIDDLSYEDITLIDNNNDMVTYQIKYHTSKMYFNRSNGDLFKTIKNKPNLCPRIKKIYFVVSKNNNTFDSFLTDWKNKKLLPIDIYNEINSLDEKNSDAKVTHYKQCLSFMEEYPKDTMLDYLSKIEIIEGKTYEELVTSTINIIKTIFSNFNDFEVFYTRYYIFDLLEQNWFGSNTPLNINNIYMSLESQLKNMETISTNHIIDNVIDNIIKLMHNYLVLKPVDKNSDTDSNEYLYAVSSFISIMRELKIIVFNFKDYITTKHAVSILILLRRINEKDNESQIIPIYKNVTRILGKRLIVDLYNDINDKVDYSNIEKIVTSLAYYTKHKVTNDILLKPFFKVILSKEDIKYIEEKTGNWKKSNNYLATHRPSV